MGRMWEGGYREGVRGGGRMRYRPDTMKLFPPFTRVVLVLKKSARDIAGGDEGVVRHPRLGQDSMQPGDQHGRGSASNPAPN